MNKFAWRIDYHYYDVDMRNGRWHAIEGAVVVSEGGNIDDLHKSLEDKQPQGYSCGKATVTKAERLGEILDYL
jgi:hypothetical protein